PLGSTRAPEPALGSNLGSNPGSTLGPTAFQSGPDPLVNPQLFWELTALQRGDIEKVSRASPDDPETGAAARLVHLSYPSFRQFDRLSRECSGQVRRSCAHRFKTREPPKGWFGGSPAPSLADV